MKLYSQDIYKIDDMLFESREVAVEWLKQGNWKNYGHSWCELKDVVIDNDLNIRITWVDEEEGEEDFIVLPVEFENFMVQVNL
jgi:hypothetical protein